MTAYTPPPPVSKNWQQYALDSFIAWFVFIALVAAIPSIMVVFALANAGQPITLVAVFGKGELYASGLALAADATGNLLEKRQGGIGMMVIGLCFVLALLGAGGTAVIITAANTEGTQGTASLSLWFFGFCAGVGVIAKAIGIVSDLNRGLHGL
jgi:hypothetical protein